MQICLHNPTHSESQNSQLVRPRVAKVPPSPSIRTLKLSSARRTTEFCMWKRVLSLMRVGCDDSFADLFWIDINFCYVIPRVNVLLSSQLKDEDLYRKINRGWFRDWSEGSSDTYPIDSLTSPTLDRLNPYTDLASCIRPPILSSIWSGQIDALWQWRNIPLLRLPRASLLASSFFSSLPRDSFFMTSQSVLQVLYTPLIFDF